LQKAVRAELAVPEEKGPNEVHAPTSTNAALEEVLEELCAPSDATVV
jgi:hypothetical protein